MKDHPILFSAPMVQAILDEHKTQTRRVMKPQPHYEGGLLFWKTPKVEILRCEDNARFRELLTIHCPCGIPGDRLWVRETFAIESNCNIESEQLYPPPYNDGRPIKRTESNDMDDYWEQCHYRATDPEPELSYDEETDPQCKWKPSIHMPRWASRITLEITGIRVERVQDISVDDAKAEGVRDPICDCGDCIDSTYRGMFQDVWREIYGYDAWDRNDWVWVIEFKRIMP